MTLSSPRAPRPTALLLGAALSLASSLCTTSALADAIAPLHDPCPAPRVVAIRGHAEVCLDPPPSDCRPGWRGVAGGECVVHSCSRDDECVGGLRCAHVDVCFETYRREHCYSELTPGSLLGGPPRPCGPNEGYVQRISGICGPGATCAGECTKGRVCLAPGAVASPTPRAPEGSGASATPPPAQAPSRGCAGCAVEPSSKLSTALALGLAIAGAITLAIRRRRDADLS